MPRDRETELSIPQLEKRVSEFKKEGLGTTLALQLLSDLSILNERLVSAQFQRDEIGRKLDKMLEGQHKVEEQARQLERMERKLQELSLEAKENTEFRLKLLGGSVAARIMYTVLGGVMAWLLSMVWNNR